MAARPGGAQTDTIDTPAGNTPAATLEHVVRDEIDRLVPPGARPALALSGGGDSTALLHFARRRDPLVLVVDHGLREGSAEVARSAADMARALGLEAKVLRWERPATARIQEAAREARYTLMGEACRAAGLSHLLVGHTRDDQRETLLMRRTRCADARAMDRVSHAPVWPGLRSVDLVRPMLGVERAELRRWLRGAGVPHHDDPSNSDPRFERVRARARLAGNTAAPRQPDRRREAERLLSELHRLGFGPGHIDAPADTDPALLALALTCVSGSAPLVAASRIQASGSARAQTVGGGRIVPTAQGYRLLRDPGGVLGRSGVAAIAEVELAAGETAIWDNRFEIAAAEPVTIRPLGTAWPDGVARPHIDIRRTLPGAWAGGELVAAPGMEGGPATFRDLARERLSGLLRARAI